MKYKVNISLMYVESPTGAGDYYCSGNDLSNFMNIPPDGIQAMAEEAGRLLEYDVVLLLLKTAPA